jgi:hypothetical protein
MSLTKLRLGTAPWFEMVGALMCEAAARSGLPPSLNVAFVERYVDGIELSQGFVQGIRFDIVDGKPSFRAGVRLGERGDITIEITTAAAQMLNGLRTADPAFEPAMDGFRITGEMRVDGDLSRMGDWLEVVHDTIVDRTI